MQYRIEDVRATGAKAKKVALLIVNADELEAITNGTEGGHHPAVSVADLHGELCAARVALLGAEAEARRVARR